MPVTIILSAQHIGSTARAIGQLRQQHRKAEAQQLEGDLTVGTLHAIEHGSTPVADSVGC